MIDKRSIHSGTGSNRTGCPHRREMLVVPILLLSSIWIVGCRNGDGGQPERRGATQGKRDVWSEVANGEDIYRWRCASCHLSDGRGVPGQFPPLAGSKRTIGDPEIPVRIVLHGMAGPLAIDGVQYDRLMPGWHDQLSSHEVAAVVSYIRSAWGNRAPAIDTRTVERVMGKYPGRTSPWQVKELER